MAMNIAYCPFCGTKLEDNENSCGECGSDLMPFMLMPSPEEFQKGMEKFMEQFSEGSLDDLAEKMKDSQTKGFYISVNTMEDRDPIVRTGDIKDLKDILRDLPIPDFVKENLEVEEDKSLEFVEAEVERVHREREEIIVNMPGVEDIDDVEIVRREGSLEITGRGSHKIYFAQVDLGEEMVRESRVEGGKLKITVEGV